jgi:hypothetical protein
MARWDPPANVDNNEHLGRRLFDEPLLTGASDQPSFKGLLLTHFEESRDDEWWLDRLGRSSADRKVISYLTPRAQAAGSTFKGQVVQRLVRASSTGIIESSQTPELGSCCFPDS